MPLPISETARRERGLRQVMTIRISPQVKKELERQARLMGVTRSEAVTRLVLKQSQKT